MGGGGVNGVWLGRGGRFRVGEVVGSRGYGGVGVVEI